MPTASFGLVFWSTLTYAEGNLIKDVYSQQSGTLSGFTWQPFAAPAPDHKLATLYHYNSLSQVVEQYSPNGEKSEFWYDRLGRLVLSQNAKQKTISAIENGKQYSYTLYDHLGRITEVGQIANATSAPVSNNITRSQSLLHSWLANSAANKEQITETVYDLPYSGFSETGGTPLVQHNLRNRVSYTSFSKGGSSLQYNQASFYSYDIHGNVDTLVQDYGSSSFAAVKNVMNENGNRFKKLVYRYDLISGKVNSVAYQPNKADQFYHRYVYDAENKLVQVQTSYDSIHWELDARYEYYKHGPLARTLIGQQTVQGLDYAYTLQGWLKGVNSTSLNAGFDIGEDGKLNSQGQFIARDAYGFSLNYFTGDYASISGAYPFPGSSAYLGGSYKPLYNGNISSMAVNIAKLNDPLLYSYTYDQLNRIKAMDAFRGLNQGTNEWSSLTAINDYKERISYDANGNILKYLRQGHGTKLSMDSMTYQYNRDGLGHLQNNRLNHVRDSVASPQYAEDIDNQLVGNFSYDSIGNLVGDNAAGISTIEWTVYGKINKIIKANGTTISYSYDAGGNRISKGVQASGGSMSYTWYVRDASGNVMATYQSSGTGADLTGYPLNMSEQHLYGSSRIGILVRKVDVKAAYIPDSILNFSRGEKQYELSNHLGNVLTTISDKKWGVASAANSSLIDYYTADVRSAQDYYPFGMLMPGRHGYSQGAGWVSCGSSSTLPQSISYNSRSGNIPLEYKASLSIEFTEGFESEIGDEFTAYITNDGGNGGGNGVDGSEGFYRYGFNGKEKLDEIYGEGNAYDLGDRGLDTRIGRTFKPDAKGAMFPNVSPYSFAMNSSLNAVDPDGKVVIFINGYYGFPTAACCGGKEKHWGKNWVSRAQSQIGDKKSRFYDGSLGGPSGVVFGQGDPVIGNSSSMDPATRRLAGYNLGKIEASDIINNLERDASGNITESIKFVTSSMGAAYQRGFSQAIVDYVGEQNAIIDTYNNGLAKNKEGSYKDPSAVKQRLKVNIEFTVDLDAFQGSELSADPNSKANYFMVNDGAESKFIGSAVPGSKQIGVDAKSKTTMHGHHPSWADTKALPKGTQNPKGSSKKENPSD